MKDNDTAHTIFMLAMVVNIIPIAFLIHVGLTDAASEYSVKELVESINTFKIPLIIAALISFVGILISFTHFRYIGQLNKLDIVQSELEEEIQKYRQATQILKDLQKTTTIQ